jgi:hypothetical protein
MDTNKEGLVRADKTTGQITSPIVKTYLDNTYAPIGGGGGSVSDASVAAVITSGSATGTALLGKPVNTATQTALNAKAINFSPVAVKTAAYTVGANELVPCDTTSGSFIVTLPTAPADKTRVIIKKIDTSANTVTVNTAGSDVYNKTGGNTTLTLNINQPEQFGLSLAMTFLLVSLT